MDSLQPPFSGALSAFGDNVEIITLGKLTGFILAHSALIGSGQDGEPLAPYAIYQVGENREAVNYPAETQAIAVQNMESEIAKYQDDVDAWASVQEGHTPSGDGKQIDIYLIKVWVNGLKEPLKIYQAFNPKPFKLIGNIKVLNFEKVGFELSQGQEFNDALDEGITSHPTASDKWESWF